MINTHAAIAARARKDGTAILRSPVWRSGTNYSQELLLKLAEVDSRLRGLIYSSESSGGFGAQKYGRGT